MKLFDIVSPTTRLTVSAPLLDLQSWLVCVFPSLIVPKHGKAYLQHKHIWCICVSSQFVTRLRIQWLTRLFVFFPSVHFLSFVTLGCLGTVLASGDSGRAKPMLQVSFPCFLSSIHAGLLVGAEQMVLGRAGQSLEALQNPFLHSPVAGRLGQSQLEVPSHHKAPQLQVGYCHNYLLPFTL